MSAYSDQDYLEAFGRFHASDECELAADPQVSPGADPGAWVQAWVWVPDHECEQIGCVPVTVDEDNEPE